MDIGAKPFGLAGDDGILNTVLIVISGQGLSPVVASKMEMAVHAATTRLLGDMTAHGYRRQAVLADRLATVVASGQRSIPRSQQRSDTERLQQQR